MRPGRPRPHTMAAAFAMDALDDRDRVRFERHLARCPECAREAGCLREAAARLATAAAVPPPAAWKERVLARAARTRQLPPAGQAVTAPSRQHPGLARWPGARPRPARHRPLLPGAALTLAGILLLTTAVAGIIGVVSYPRAAPRVSGGQAIASVLTAPDATMVTARVRDGGTATVVMSRRERMLVFAASGLRALPPSQRYELWLMGRGQDRPAGMLPEPTHGMTGPVSAAGLRPGDRLGMTVEPARGSRRPSSPVILLLPL